MTVNQQLSVFGQLSPNTTGIAGQVLTSNGSNSPTYWSNVTSNIASAFGQANAANIAAGAAFDRANTAQTIAIAAFAQANTGGGGGGSSLNTANIVIFSNTRVSTNANSGAVIIAGGLGVSGNVYTANRVGYSNTTNSSIVYTYYNTTTLSLDTVFE